MRSECKCIHAETRLNYLNIIILLAVYTILMLYILLLYLMFFLLL